MQGFWKGRKGEFLFVLMKEQFWLDKVDWTWFNDFLEEYCLTSKVEMTRMCRTTDGYVSSSNRPTPVRYHGAAPTTVTVATSPLDLWKYGFYSFYFYPDNGPWTCRKKHHLGGDWNFRALWKGSRYLFIVSIHLFQFPHLGKCGLSHDAWEGEQKPNRHDRDGIQDDCSEHWRVSKGRRKVEVTDLQKWCRAMCWFISLFFLFCSDQFPKWTRPQTGHIFLR